ncbi:putative YVTN beta-propeller repeat-containing protein [Candidatus Zixiibacteriota bacterium]|nr:putative YVTN beta-propeller repeat-containing protein [candidate division Zixibacteria bacterium]
MKKFVITFTIVAVLAIFMAPAFAQEKAAEPAPAKHTYVGASKCMMCHKKDNVYPTWLESKHAKAWDSLKPEEQKDEKCVACHSTGKNAAGEMLTGVQCEACHGPGSDYMKMSVMKDKKLALEAGLIMPDEKVCKKCHENVPAQFASKEPFDFAKMKLKVHAMAAKEEAPAEKK